VAISSDTPPQKNNNTILYPEPVPGEHNFVIETMRVDAEFFSVYGIEPVAGRLFSKDIESDIQHLPEDKTREGTQSIVVNETFVDKLGFASPEEAVGAVFWDGGGPDGGDQVVRTTVIGVIRDVQLRSIDFTITPMLFTLEAADSAALSVLTLDVAPGEMASTLAAVEALWTRFAPQLPVYTSWVDAEIAEQYDAIETRSTPCAASSQDRIVAVTHLKYFAGANERVTPKTPTEGLFSSLLSGPP
jgi:putative ABC transport system permease protein